MSTDSVSPFGLSRPATPPNNQLTPGDRYRRDPVFHSLVDLLTSFIHKAQYTPTELREAAILASIHHAQLTVESYIHVADPEGRKLTMKFQGLIEEAKEAGIIR